MDQYFRPIARADEPRPDSALTLAGGWCWFDRVEVLARGRAPEVIAAAELPADARQALCAPRADLAGLAMARPQIMGILNTTPDSFSDGGRHNAPAAAADWARSMAAAGMTLLDVGGESTRPGSDAVAVEEEIARTAPVIAALRAGGHAGPISIDTRKAPVAAAALAAGAELINDVAAFTHDPDIAGVAARGGAAVCLMHAQGDPKTMQDAPVYGDVLLDVYDYLEARVRAAEAAGIPRSRISIDPGIGFGKTVAHNLSLLRGLSLFHGLGCPILLGVSRKRFIGEIAGEPEAARRMPGTLAVTLAGVAQGVQIHRVHDVAEIAQGLRIWQALHPGNWETRQ